MRDSCCIVRVSKYAFVFLLLLSIVSPMAGSHALAQVSTPQVETGPAAETEIVVIGLKDPFTLAAKQLNEMLQAFWENRSSYAPNSRLFVELKDLGDGLPLDARFVLSDTRGEYILAADNSGRIYFPDAAPGVGPYQLRSNVSRSKVGISLWVMSPDSTEKLRTIGDLRLQCRVMWGAAKFTVSPFVRSLFGAAGACKTSKIAFYFRSAKPLNSGFVEHGEKSIPLIVGQNRLAYRAPIWDENIPNSAPVHLKLD